MRECSKLRRFPLCSKSGPERLWWIRRMSDAVEGAEVMIYGVSRRYKESANCRLEANYAHQQG